MKNKSTSNLIFIIIIVIIIVSGGYLYINSHNAILPPITATNMKISSINIKKITSIGSIRLDTSIFSDPRFNALINTDITVNPETIGRTNPFAQLH